MRKKDITQSAPASRSLGEGRFFNLRVLIGLFIVPAGVFLGLAGLGRFSALAATMAQAQQKHKIITNSKDPLVPNGFDCSKIHEFGIDKQMNFRAGAIMIACGQARGGGTSATSPSSPLGALTQFIRKVFSPLAYGGTDVDLTTANGQSPFLNTGSPVVLYNRPSATWYTVWLDGGCPGLGGYKSTTPWDANSWTHNCIHIGTEYDRQSGWTDMNPSSPFYGRMYVSWNDFASSANIFVRYSTDNGNTWTDERQITNGSPFIRNVQITGDLVTGDVYIAGMN